MRDKNKLTTKETIFVGEMIKTKGNKTESALRAYDTQSRYNAKHIGARVSKKPRVQEAYAQQANNSRYILL